MPTQRDTLLCHYRYDPLDRLTGQAPPDTPERQRFYCKSRLATEIQGAMGYSIVQHGDQLLAQQQSEGNALDTTLLATDQQRSVVHTLKANHPRQPIAYSPYGHRPAENGLLSLLGFNGERPDPVTGHYLLGNGYRAFNPVLMRFNSPDSLSPFGEGGENPYAYCSGDPMNFTDSSGQFRLKLPKWISRTFAKTNKNANTSKHANKFATPLSGQYIHIGHHASTSNYRKSLENGLDPKFIGLSRGAGHGPGFYVTKNLDMAESLAIDMAQKGKDISPMIFDVFVKAPNQAIEPLNGILHNTNALLNGIKEAGSAEHLVISTSRYKDVVLKGRDIRVGQRTP